MAGAVRRAFLLSLVLLVLRGGAGAAELPQGWPQSWKDAYSRFEKFRAAQDKFLPPAGLEIFSDGRISTSLPDAKNTSVVFHLNGSQILGMTMLGGQLFGDGRDSIFQPGTYTAFVQTTASGTYQTLYPFITFRVEKIGKEEGGRLQVRMVDSSSSGDARWPNERLQHFIDYHTFPKHLRDDILKKNSRVSPDVVLSITQSGTIARSALDPALEKFLRWRVYVDGQLIEQSSAFADLRHRLQSTGDYVVFVGIDGPEGFLPVSNCLRFPLFPTKSGGVEVFPTVTNPDRVPDFLLEVLPPDGLSEVLSQGWAQGAGYYNKTLVYALGSDTRLDDPKKQALLTRWTAWSWALWSQRMADKILPSEISCFNFQEDAGEPSKPAP